MRQVALFISLGFTLSPAACNQQNDDQPPSASIAQTPVEKTQGSEKPLLAVDEPAVTSAARTLDPEREASEIKKLIRSLSRISPPAAGYSTNLSDFLLTAVSSCDLGGGIMVLPAAHPLRDSKAFRRLVELGPRALPFLLKALDDETPTQLKIKIRPVNTI